MTEGAGPTARRRADWTAMVIAAAMFVLAAIVAWDASRLGGAASYARIGPQTVPYLIAGCLAALGLWTVAEGFRRDFPEREPQEITPVIWIVGGLLAQILLLKTAGFSIATGVMFGLVASGLGRTPVWITVPIGIVLSLLAWLVFSRLLSLNLPAGPLETAILTMLQGPR